jgi:hypothetical protein
MERLIERARLRLRSLFRRGAADTELSRELAPNRGLPQPWAATTI